MIPSPYARQLVVTQPGARSAETPGYVEPCRGETERDRSTRFARGPTLVSIARAGDRSFFPAAARRARDLAERLRTRESSVGSASHQLPIHLIPSVTRSSTLDGAPNLGMLASDHRREPVLHERVQKIEATISVPLQPSRKLWMRVVCAVRVFGESSRVREADLVLQLVGSGCALDGSASNRQRRTERTSSRRADATVPSTRRRSDRSRRPGRFLVRAGDRFLGARVIRWIASAQSVPAGRGGQQRARA